MAIKDVGTLKQEIDWQLLYAIYEAEKAVSFNQLYQTYSKGNPDYLNSRYYESIDRLIKRGWILQSLNHRGKRRWSITPAGRIEIERLNRRAMEYLKMQDQGGE
jgi:hypothetical protein